MGSRIDPNILIKLAWQTRKYLRNLRGIGGANASDPEILSAFANRILSVAEVQL